MSSSKVSKGLEEVHSRILAALKPGPDRIATIANLTGLDEGTIPKLTDNMIDSATDEIRLASIGGRPKSGKTQTVPLSLVEDIIADIRAVRVEVLDDRRNNRPKLLFVHPEDPREPTTKPMIYAAHRKVSTATG
jgi:hypothetical protein